jgi:hypothetical protein
VTKAEKVLASRLLDAAADKYANHSCNDVDAEMFDDLSGEDLDEMRAAFNKWRNGGSDLSLLEIGDYEWMRYFAARIGEDRP